MVTQVCKLSTWESELGDSQETVLPKKKNKTKQKTHKDLKRFYR